MPAYGATLLLEAIVTIAPGAAGEPLERWNVRPAGSTLAAHEGAAKAETATLEYPPNLILDHPLQAMLLATIVAASLGLLARHLRPAPERGLTAFDPPPTTHT